MVKFKKQYNSSPSRNGDIYYSGKIISGSRITGNWWVPGKKRLFGTFFMWNKDYEVRHISKTVLDPYFLNVIESFRK